jgi:hypothetical protein
MGGGAVDGPMWEMKTCARVRVCRVMSRSIHTHTMCYAWRFEGIGLWEMDRGGADLGRENQDVNDDGRGVVLVM